MPWAVVTNYTREFLGLRWSAPLARFYRPPTLLATCTTRKSNKLELKYTAALSVYPSEFSDRLSCMSGSEFLTGRCDWVIQFSQSQTVRTDGLDVQVYVHRLYPFLVRGGTERPWTRFVPFFRWIVTSTGEVVPNCSGRGLRSARGAHRVFSRREVAYSSGTRPIHSDREFQCWYTYGMYIRYM